MSDSEFAKIAEIERTTGPAAAIAELIRALEASRDWHRLFDALLLKKKFEMGLPIARPASFDQIPEDRQHEFEESYIEAARRVGRAFLVARIGRIEQRAADEQHRAAAGDVAE